MSELSSVIEGYRSESLTELPDARIEEDFCELQRVSEAIEAERLRRLGELDRRRTYERDGYLSAASWLLQTFRMSWGLAREQVRMARALRDMPQTRRALEGGEISPSAVRVLATAREADPEAYRRCEKELVEAARIHRIGELQRATGYFRQAVEDEHRVRDEDTLADRRRFHVSPTIFGMVRVDGDLDPDNGEALMTALGAIMDADARRRDPDDGRSPAQRRADALGELSRQWLDRSDRPSVGGERPHVTVTVEAGALPGGAPHPPSGLGSPVERAELDHARLTGTAELDHARLTGTAELDHAGPVDPGIARVLACDASIMRVVMAGRSEPLDVGRRTPVIPPAMRRAVIVRDGCCRFPRCDRPHPWCDVHHVVHWADGGPTAVPNLILLCRRHHRLIHQRSGFRLRLVNGRPEFRRPDGSVLEDPDRGPP